MGTTKRQEKQLLIVYNSFIFLSNYKLLCKIILLTFTLIILKSNYKLLCKIILLTFTPIILKVILMVIWDQLRVKNDGNEIEQSVYNYNNFFYFFFNFFKGPFKIIKTSYNFTFQIWVNINHYFI